jgi:predicted nucleic-acid-binding Zn-ribbon protein
MSVTVLCSKCGSRRVIPRARVVDRGHANSELKDLTVVVYKDPDALLFKRAHKESLHARICGECGFTELYLDGASELYESYEAGNRAGSNR